MQMVLFTSYLSVQEGGQSLDELQLVQTDPGEKLKLMRRKVIC